MGLDSATFPSMGVMGGGGGQYVENTQEISKNQGFANFNFLFTVPPYFLKMIICI